MEKIAVFPGSFDPFTIGHKAILDMALPLFDKIIVAVGVNSAKNYFLEAQQRVRAIADLYAGNPKIAVETYDSLTVDFCKKRNATAILRGLRNITDFEYEKTMAQTNRALAGIETVFLMTPPEYEHISSSIVRELLAYGADASKFLP
ncbi:MAG: pantetheine-phosphate adenylyltransferase [Bacteroidales bacterium]|nr:pantetheine-phosphate adenylyltransferase [Bacteroidales bacterium]